MRTLLLAAAAVLVASPASGIPPLPPPPPPKAPELTAIVQPVSGARMKRAIEKLVSFGTRHTLSSQTDPKRGIGAALNWTEAELKRYSRACGGCLQVGRASQVMEGRRLPAPTRITNVFALQRGTERPNDVVIITGHIDSRVTDPMDWAKDAPGANDDGSGTAAVIEAARVLSKHKFPATIVYAALSGEEQGLYGGRVMADYAKQQGWNVVANLNNDIIGNSCGSDGVCNASQVRVFSEGPRWQGQQEFAADLRRFGGENDSPSRNLSRFLDTLAEQLPLQLDVMQVWRNDRYGRGGDHTEFLNAGYPAVRFSVAVEDYDHQHQDLRVENGVKYGDTIDEMDFAYLEKVTKLNVAALAALASAPPPPEAKAQGAVSNDTTISWTPVPGAAGYVVRWRPTDSSRWQEAHYLVAGSGPQGSGCFAHPNPQAEEASEALPCVFVLRGVRVDNHVFGVASVSRDMWVGPVAAAVPGGAFKPWVAPTTQPSQ